MFVMKPLGLYIHIPFCKKKCNYCDFLSRADVKKEDQTAYVEALLVELKYYADRNMLLDSVYIGGGTPSLLEGDLILRIMEGVTGSFALSEEAEITIEANPGLLDRDKLMAYRRAGINRLSLGAQSLNDELLHFMGRIHSSNTFIDNFHLARDCGFENISADLIFAVPGQTIELWIDSLKKTISLGPEHISFYSLQIEAGTPFYGLWEKGAMKAVDDETDRRMYHEALEWLKNKGYGHYEISNAAKPGYESRHNLKYWSMDQYLGIGLGSHYYINGTRFSNETDLEEYIHISERVTGEGVCDKIFVSLWHPSPWAVWHHRNTEEDEISEFLFTGLRKIDGVSLSVFEERFGKPITAVYENSIMKHSKAGLLELNWKEDLLRLTAKGLDLFNQVLVDFV